MQIRPFFLTYCPPSRPPHALALKPLFPLGEIDAHSPGAYFRVDVERPKKGFGPFFFSILVDVERFSNPWLSQPLILFFVVKKN
jgi:hypothetical protein